MRKATPARVPGHRFHIISIPAFREEGDIEVGDKVTNEVISIPAFREEGDVVFCEREVFMNISIPAFRAIVREKEAIQPEKAETEKTEEA